MKKEDMVVGKNYLVMTPTTHYWVGELVAVSPLQISLTKSSWIPQIGRHHKAFEDGAFEEWECHPREAVLRLPGIASGSVVLDWAHEKLPEGVNE